MQYDGPRTCTVLQMPDNYVISNVRLPHTLSNGYKPLSGSAVLVASLDSYQHFILCVLRDPVAFLQQAPGQKISDLDNDDQVNTGELYWEATGDPTLGVSGRGASIYVANDGTITLKSGLTKEYLIIGGYNTDNDGQVYLVGDNGNFQSNINPTTHVMSSFRFDINNNLALGNYLETIPTGPGPTVEAPIGTLTIDTLGNMQLGNYTAGVSNSYLKLDSLGNMTLQNKISSIALNAAGNIAVTGTTINLNKGTLGAARLTDTVLADVTTDPVFYNFWAEQAIIFTALPPATNPADVIVLANALKAALIVLASTYPPSLTSTITTASTTVTIGN